jgi:hypothetical protein
MDDLSTLANSRGRGLRIFRALIGDDATGANDTVNVRIPAYEPSRNFGPCHWAPRILNDGSPLWPMRNDECIVALDENDQAEIINWWADDPTTLTTWLEFGPFTADPGGDIAANGTVSVTMAHLIERLWDSTDDLDLTCVVTGNLLDGGHHAEYCSWKSTINQTQVVITLSNHRVGGTAYPKLQFTIKLKVY